MGKLVFLPRKRADAPPEQVRCRATGCAAGGLRCAYVDGRGRACESFWCAEHRAEALGRLYCRRHATTMQALGRADRAAAMPDLGNRAAALAGWVSRELDEPVRRALLGRSTSTTRLVVDDVGLAVGGRERRWRRRWKLVDHTGVLHGVGVEVEETDDTCLVVRVDGRVIGSGVPPWITRRRQGEPGGAAVDLEERRVYREGLIRAIELMVSREELDRRYSG